MRIWEMDARGDQVASDNNSNQREPERLDLESRRSLRQPRQSVRGRTWKLDTRSGKRAKCGKRIKKKPMRKPFVPIFPVVRSRRVTLIHFPRFHLWFWNCTTPTAWIVPKRGSAGIGIYCSNFLWDSLTTTYFSAHDRIPQRFSSDKEFFIFPGTPATNEPGGISIPMGTTVPAAMMD